ncbi:S-adenosyl-L-methionine-dependent methyltransferase [Trichoderma pleuroticola]
MEDDVSSQDTREIFAFLNSSGIQRETGPVQHTDSTEESLDQPTSKSALPASLRSPIQDSETTNSLSNSPGRSVIRSTSIKSFSSTTPLSVDVPECVLAVPKSCYEDFQPPEDMPVLSERKAIQALSLITAERAQSFSEIQLDEFAIYIDNDKFPEEMRSLHHLHTKIGHSSFYFDGIISIGDTKFYVRRVPVAAVPIGNYSSISKHTVRDNIWLQSSLGYKKSLFYKLGKPAKEYARFFYPFLWVADLAKHFVDFLYIMAENKRSVSIHHFRSTFAAWLKESHGRSPEFIEWLNQHPSDDYRTSIAANIGFLHKETLGVLDHHKAYSHAIWAEIWEFQSFTSPPGVDNPPTIVTQYIYDCFKHLPFGDRLQVVPLSLKTNALRNGLIRQRHLEFPSKLHQATKSLSKAAKARIANIRPGDTISTLRDDAASGTLWKRELSEGFADVDRWFALVQSVHVNKKGVRMFDVIWYYQPVDTLCGLMKYPWNNELFLSDHCSCTETSKIEESEVLGVHDVDFWGTSTTAAELFCRQTYLQESRRWVTLDESHLQCCHTSSLPLESQSLKVKSGNTYLLHLDLKSSFSEPCEFMSLVREGGRRVYQFRRLLRRHQVDPNARDARPNELIYSEQICKVSRDRITGPCSVRFFRDGDEIPTPYDHDGAGNLFYITHRQIVANGVPVCLPLEEAPKSLHQGFDPLQELQKLRGIDLFCGGGNFGRGLEDGGGIEMKWANDYDAKAIHTYMANVKKPGDVHPFLGSIDDLQLAAIRGQFADNVPRIGDVDFVSGGSPCPGFSRLTNDKTTAAQRKNQSLVAAFASFVDLYRPKYGVLENVLGMIHKKESRNQDVFSQLICSLVGLGYQTQFFFLDASSCGSPQPRPRIFVVFAAPGLELPTKPVQTHSHPPKTREIGIGWLPNGQHMATREMPAATPFKYISAEEATADLPPIHDAKPDICVAYPDHRSHSSTKMERARISAIPVRPWGMSFAQAWYGEDKAKGGSGTMTAAERKLFPGTNEETDMSKQPLSVQPQSNAYGRMFPNKLFNTVTTRPTANDAKNGRLLHWRENRLISLMEARRAQGFRDEDVLLGDPSNQYRIVGNSVARQVAVALGVKFHEAWVTSLKRNRELERASSRSAAEVDDFAEDRVTLEAIAMNDMKGTSARQLKSLTIRRQSTRDLTPSTRIGVEQFSSRELN